MIDSEFTDRIAHIDGLEIIEPDERYSVDGIFPKAVVRPRSVNSLQRLITIACERRWGLIPFGAGTAIHIGNVPSAFDIAIEMTQLQTIVEFEPADLVVTAEAGVRMKDLQDALKAHRLFLPIDPPDENEATVGGVVATNAFGSLLFGYGTASDWLIGIQVIQPSGKLTNFGGKVVKNVAGYDMVRLYAGSYGTLGVITRATFRLLPVPERRFFMALMFPNGEHAERVLSEIIHTELRPSTVMMVEVIGHDEAAMATLQRLVSECGVPLNAPVLFVGFDDFAEAVSYQADLLTKIATPYASSVCTFEGDDAEERRRILRRLQSGRDAKMHIRLNVSPRVAMHLHRKVTELADRCGVKSPIITSHILDGVVFVSAFDCDDDAALHFPRQLMDAIESLRGNMIIERAPTHIKPLLPIWGRNLKSHSIMRRIKELLDERMVMSPGRFIAGM
ncbi:MAG: hypothetical protein GDYSWBUE_000318 [Candidatus Fervidibacterota bacterium]